jgi:hypothetical protein
MNECSPFTAICRGNERRDDVRSSGSLCGIDDVEVYPDGVTICARLFGAVPDGLKADNVRITGGTRITGIKVIDVDFEEHEDEGTCLRATLDRTGDLSVYCLCLVDVPREEEREPRERTCTFHPLPPTPLVTAPPPGVDPRYACAEFRFHLDCPTNEDCAPRPCVAEPAQPGILIDYLARDFTGFRQLLLDRLSLTMPQWRERHVPDVLVTVAEAIAYLADGLSYQLDAIATEAYLTTARRRISVRRHARLLDYRMHEGCNARAFLCFGLEGTDEIKRAASEFLFAAPDAAEDSFTSGLVSYDSLKSSSRCFEPVVCAPGEEIRILAAHSEIPFYTWRNRDCCLPRGATRATLRDGRFVIEGEGPGRVLQLKPGDILILEEIRGTATDSSSDADPAKRWAVRLVKVEQLVDPLDMTPLLEVEWAREDALPFPLILSAWTQADAADALRLPPGGKLIVDARAAAQRMLPAGGVTIETAPRHGTAGITDEGMLTYEVEPDFQGADTIDLAVTTTSGERVAFALTLLVGDEPYCQLVETAVARGNVILVDHGRTIIEENDDWLVSWETSAECCRCDGTAADVLREPEAFTIRLEERQLCHSSPPPCDGRIPASHMLEQDPHQAVAAVALDMADARSGNAFPGTFDWQARSDLIGSLASDRHFVAEIDEERQANLRCGDGDCAARPPFGARFRARYRVGNGIDGNVGRDTITAFALRDTVIDGASVTVRNPLPAQDGVEPESIEEVRRRAPNAYGRKLDRAITALDYGRVGGTDDRLQGANCTFGWTGIGYSADVALDPLAEHLADADLRATTLARIEAARRIGHDVLIASARPVPLRIAARVCVDDDYSQTEVGRAVRALMSTGVLPDGTLGLFHPDSLQFGQDFYASRIVTAIQAIEGVTHVELTRFSRLDDVKPITTQRLDTGIIAIADDQIAQCDSDPDFPERGRFSVRLVGGR